MLMVPQFQGMHFARCGAKRCLWQLVLPKCFPSLVPNRMGIFKYRLEYPQADPKDCTYDSGGKKQCIHHHPYHNLAIKTIQPSTAEVSVVNCSLNSSEASKVVEQHSTAETGASNLLSTVNGVKEISKDESSMVATYDVKVFNVPLLPECGISLVLTAIMSKEMYIKEIQTMFPNMNCGRLSISSHFLKTGCETERELLKMHSLL